MIAPYIILLLVAANFKASFGYLTKVACEGDVFTLTCSENYPIDLISVMFGRMDTTTCQKQGSMSNVSCKNTGNATTILIDKCEDNVECSFLVSIDLFGDPCPGTYKYLEVQYQCIQ